MSTKFKISCWNFSKFNLSIIFKTLCCTIYSSGLCCKNWVTAFQKACFLFVLGLHLACFVSRCFLFVCLLYDMIYSLLGTYFLNHLQREKKNLQDLSGVFVFSVAERENLDRPTARLIKEFDCIEGKS
jgi:hypothetical protein